MSDIQSWAGRRDGKMRLFREREKMKSLKGLKMVKAQLTLQSIHSWRVRLSPIVVPRLACRPRKPENGPNAKTHQLIPSPTLVNISKLLYSTGQETPSCKKFHAKKVVNKNQTTVTIPLRPGSR